MHIHQFRIQNFKSFQDVTFHFNHDVNILTGINNSGKTSVLEALSLWHECFKLLVQGIDTKRTPLKGKPKKGDQTVKNESHITLRDTSVELDLEYIYSVSLPEPEDIYYDCQNNNSLLLEATFKHQDGGLLSICFSIFDIDNRYFVKFENDSTFSNEQFNFFFKKLPDPFTVFYAKPIASINTIENLQTRSKISDASSKHKSASVIRNRISLIAKNSELVFEQFERDLSYIMFNLGKEIKLVVESDLRKGKRCIVKYKVDNREIYKDLALLGNGTLHLIDILLSFYDAEILDKDYKLIMLDEPDSYIHRDIQKRLIEKITQFSKNSQVIVTSHNESFIRSAALHHLFHLDGSDIADFRPANEREIERIQPRFKGIIPSIINPIIRSIGEITGLDFINAIECDRLIFVEGESDTRYINVLLKQRTKIGEKHMFWVMGGINAFFENILAYKTVFSAIKNGKSLWEKCCVIIDRDYLSEEHIYKFKTNFKKLHQLDFFTWDSYTFESSVFEHLPHLSMLISLWIKSKTGRIVDKNEVSIELNAQYDAVYELLKNRMTEKHIEDIANRYRNIREKSNTIFNRPDVIITENDIQLPNLVRKNYNDILDNGEYYKLMKKEDVQMVISNSIKGFDVNFNCETDFIELIKMVNKSTWIHQWDFLMKI